MIREYKTEDTDAVVGIYYDASLLAHPFLSEAFLQKVIVDIRDVYLPQVETWIFEQAGEPRGFISLMDSKVAALFVSPDWHGQGIGQALVDHAVSLKGPDLEVEVFRDNEIGRRFYARYGFRQVDAYLHEESGQMSLCLRLEMPLTTREDRTVD